MSQIVLSESQKSAIRMEKIVKTFLIWFLPETQTISQSTHEMEPTFDVLTKIDNSTVIILPQTDE